MKDFLDISRTLGRVFEIGVSHTNGDLATDWSPHSQFLDQELTGKHVWLNAKSSKELSERLRHFQSAYLSSSTDTSACVLIRQSEPVDLPLLKDFREVLTLPKGSLVPQQNIDETWSIVRSPEKLRVLYLASTVDKVSAEAGLMTGRILAASRAGLSRSNALRMMFAGRAAGANANILFDSGASHNYVSTKFAKLTGVTVSPSLQKIRLGSDQEVSPDGEAVVYIRVGMFNQPVKCLVMNLLFEVDVILGDEFMDKYDCVLHYGRRCIQIRKGRKHITVKSPPMHRESPSDFEAVPKVMSASQLRRAVRRGERVFLATLKSLDSDTTASESTTSSGQPDRPAGEKPWVSDLIGQFSEVFQDPLPDGLPPERSEGHSIPTEPGHPPPFRQMYRLSPLEYRELEKQVTAFLKAGILEVSTSPYGAPVLFVPKPNGRGLRLCVDYRALNSITIKNRCTIPRIDDLLDAVSGSKYFTSLDLTSGYHQILISEEDRPKTAFRTPFGHFQFKVLIEGLTNAPATFQTAMNSIFHPFLRKFVVCLH